MGLNQQKHCPLGLRAQKKRGRMRENARPLSFYRTGPQSYLAADVLQSSRKGMTDPEGNSEIFRAGVTSPVWGAKMPHLGSQGQCPPAESREGDAATPPGPGGGGAWTRKGLFSDLKI